MMGRLLVSHDGNDDDDSDEWISVVLDVRSFCVGIAFHECKMR